MIASDRALSRINSGLLGCIVVINLYVISAPFLPQLLFWSKSHNGRTMSSLTTTLRHTVSDHPIHQSNRVIIPAMLLDQSINEGHDTYAVLNKGIWHWPDSSTPDRGSNTILIGHRFTYTNPRGVFYFLDKVHTGDEIGITWNDKSYIYKVFEIKVVHPTQTDILNPTTQPTLTLYTCTPLWWPKDRLVVTAHLERSP